VVHFQFVVSIEEHFIAIKKQVDLGADLFEGRILFFEFLLLEAAG
jgi:hypothetical protein